MEIVCLSCRKHLSNRVQWARKTWAADRDVNYVIGDPDTNKTRRNGDGLLRIPVKPDNPAISDEYLGTSWKIYAALQHLYVWGKSDRYLICDDDTYCAVDRLEKIEGDWIGQKNIWIEAESVCGGGGIILSKKAVEAIIEPEFNPEYIYGDIWISRLLNKANINLIHHPGFIAFGNRNQHWKDVFTYHPIRSEEVFDKVHECITVTKW